MCGRYTRNAAYKVLMDYYNLPIIEDEEFSDVRLSPSMDCQPGSLQPVVRIDDNGERQLVVMRWGFNMTIQGKVKTVFNTKSEGVLESKLWESRLKTRCVVPASAFLEWPNRIRTAISLKDRPIIGFAALWGNWSNPKTQQVEPTFSIFTTEPNPVMQSIHNRQPVILEPGEYEEWMQQTERPPVHLLRIFSEDKTVVTPDAKAQLTLF
jgi:putative SOS response-associated peptidase YedK